MCPRLPVSHGPPEEAVASMNSAAPASGKPSTRSSSSGYRQKALAEIRNSLLPFATNSSGCDSSAASCVSSISSASGSATSGIGSVSGLSSVSNNCVDKELNALRQTLTQLIAMGYTEVSTILFIIAWYFNKIGWK